MSAVDVVAVLDDLAAGIHIGQHEAARVRAAVAELIEAAYAMQAYIGSRRPISECFERRSRLRAALASVQGVQS